MTQGTRRPNQMEFKARPNIAEVKIKAKILGSILKNDGVMII